MKTTADIVSMLLPEVRAHHVFLYAYENIYEYQDGIYKEINEDNIHTYTNQAKTSTNVREEEVSRNVKNEVVGHIKATTLASAKELEERVQDNLIAFKNGYLDINELKEDKIILHPFEHPLEKADAPIFFFNIPHNLNITKLENYKTKWTNEHLASEHILQELAPTIYNLFESQQGTSGVKLQISKIAYCLMRSNPYKVFFMELGPKDTGKTTYISLVEKVIGEENTSHKSIQDISNYAFSAIALHNMLLNVHDDLPRKMINDTGMVKQLTGESIISGHRKFKTDLDFKNFAKLMFTTNELPTVAQLDDDAFFSRLVLTIYKNKFERSDFIKKLLSNEDEIEGLIIACVVALRDLMLRNSFADNYAEYAEFWRRHSNSIYDFVKTGVEKKTLMIHPDLKIEKEELYIMYCESEKVPEKKTTFTQELTKLFGISGQAHVTGFDGKQKWAYAGIGLYDSELANKEVPQVNPESSQTFQAKCSYCGQSRTCHNDAFGHIECSDCENARIHKNEEPD